MKYLLLVFFSLFLLNCQDSKSEKPSAETIINTAIEVSGGDIINSSTIKFDFRDIHFKAIRNHGMFQFEREFRDSTAIKDVLNNNGFQRFVNDFPMALPDSMATKYSASVNSVHYFSVLPFGLNDAAVHKKRLDDVQIKNQKYHSIKVTFDQDGGGEDFEDVFMYWIHKETHKVDYLAYSYNEEDGKGLRFREAYNERYVEGIRFVDYNNYKPEDERVALSSLPQLFESGALNLLSKIELERITVTPNL